LKFYIVAPASRGQFKFFSHFCFALSCSEIRDLPSVVEIPNTLLKKIGPSVLWSTKHDIQILWRAVTCIIRVTWHDKVINIRTYFDCCKVTRWGITTTRRLSQTRIQRRTILSSTIKWTRHATRTRSFLVSFTLLHTVLRGVPQIYYYRVSLTHVMPLSLASLIRFSTE